MALGYQGLLLIEDRQYLVSDSNLDHVRPEIASDGTYSPKTIGEATGRVHLYDLDQFTGGFNIDASADLLDMLFDSTNGWVLKRDEPKDVLLYSNKENDYNFGNTFWTRISLSTGPGNILISSFDITMIPGAEPSGGGKYSLPLRKLQVGDDYIGQRFGFEVGGNNTNPISFELPAIKQPIPYWQTKFNFKDEVGNPIPDGIYVTNWSLEIINNISGRNTCAAVSGTNDHPGPNLIQVGLASVTLNVTFVTVVTPGSEGEKEYNIPERFSDVTINIGNIDEPRTLSLGRIDGSVDGNDNSTSAQQTSDATNITGVGSMTEFTYIASGYFTLPHLV